MLSNMKNLSSRLAEEEKITLLSVSADPDDHRSMRAIVGEAGWRLSAARSCSEAARVAAQMSPAVVTCEREMPDGSWTELMRLLSALENPPPLVVLSRHADEQLWAEVLNLGGYDVLAKPLDGSEVTRVLSMASRYGRTQAERLAPALP
jgi:DNA-binding response OmpR family regulator